MENIKEITDICFRKNDKINHKTDVIFIFGSLSNISEIMNSLYKLLDNKVTEKIIISGGINPRRKKAQIINGYNVLKDPELKIIASCFDHSKYPNIEIITEEKSTHTKENVVLSLPYLKDAKDIYFICKSHHAGRAYRTLKKSLPNANLYQATYNSSCKKCNAIIFKENWSEYENTTQAVMGELSRIQLYGSKDDIALTPEDKTILKKINIPTL